jgi:hypothetical protein
LPWPHYFVDLSGIGGSADPASRLVVIAACSQLAPSSLTQPASAPASPSAAASPSASASGTGQPCLKPELVALSL